jgi:redox-sensitive bicupin YhaK (pirin superfamily)
MEIRRAAERFRTEELGIDAWHCFSYAEHYDPANVGFAVLTACNDFTLHPGAGFAPHRHSETEIVTWLLDGELSHTDDGGHRATLRPGEAQRMTAGRGVVHAESNDGMEPTRFVQTWVTPSEPGLAPSYDRHDFGTDLATGRLIAVASGSDAAPLRIAQPGATLYAVRTASSVALPVAPHVHVYVTRGEITLDGQPLAQGDEARIADGATHRLSGRAAEALIWEMHATA